MGIFIILHLIMGGVGLHRFYNYYLTKKTNLLPVALCCIPVLIICLYITVFYLEAYIFGFGPYMFGMTRLNIYVPTPAIVFLPIILAAEMALISRFTILKIFSNFTSKEIFYICMFIGSLLSMALIAYWEIFVEDKSF